MTTTHPYATSIDNYQATATKIRKSVEGVSPELLLWRPSPHAWSIQEIVGHLIDSGIVNTYRIRKIAAEPPEAIATFAHEQWVAVQPFHQLELSEMLDFYDVITTYNALFLSRLDVEQWDRYGTKLGEPITIRHIVDTFICHHVEGHLQQIERNKQAFAEEPPIL